jgi:MFS family permease
VIVISKFEGYIRGLACGMLVEGVLGIPCSDIFVLVEIHSLSDHDLTIFLQSPYNWSHKYRAFVAGIAILTVLNSVLGSSLPSGYAAVLGEHFGITSQIQLVLPISCWLLGYVIGPLVFGPLSERYGRQIVMFSTFAFFTIFNVAINFSPNFASYVIFRLLMGIAGSSPISVGGGVVADLYNSPVHRGRGR